MKAVIELDVPNWQIGQDVAVYFPDTMMKHGKCELLKEQTEIVRCKDCKYYDHFNGCMSWHDVNSNNDNWFCADGERKEGR